MYTYIYIYTYIVYILLVCSSQIAQRWRQSLRRVRHGLRASADTGRGERSGVSFGEIYALW